MEINRIVAQTENINMLAKTAQRRLKLFLSSRILIFSIFIAGR